MCKGVAFASLVYTRKPRIAWICNSPRCLFELTAMIREYRFRSRPGDEGKEIMLKYYGTGPRLSCVASLDR